MRVAKRVGTGPEEKDPAEARTTRDDRRTEALRSGFIGIGPTPTAAPTCHFRCD